MKKIYTPSFAGAIKDYYYLLQKAYPQKAVLKIIGDRYELNGFQRTILYRGIYAKSVADPRKRRRTGKLNGRVLAIDGYNVILTVGGYLAGLPVFISNDGFLRDATETHGKVKRSPLFIKALGLVLDYLQNNRAAPYFYLDSPISKSGELAAEINLLLKKRQMTGEAVTVKSPDFLLKNRNSGLIATSDSMIIDVAPVKCFDLARKVLENNFHPRFVFLKHYLYLFNFFNR